MLAIETRGLTKTYRAKRALDHLDLHVPEGAIYGFVGRNGAGKSTTMKLLSGLSVPDDGELLLFEGPPHAAEGRIGAVVETPGLLGNLTALQNLMAKALALGVVDARSQCAGLLTTVGLSNVASTRVKAFSLGMKQRLGLALALVGTPDLLLLDEPFNGLDPEATRAMRSLLVRLNQERGVTIVISSHVLDQLDRICTCYGVVRDGQTVREMSAEAVAEECGDSLIVRTADPSRSLAILQTALPGLTLRMLPDEAIVVSEPYDQGSIAHVLHEHDQTVLELSVRKRDIEEYFLDLMEGGHRHA